jgi:rod shape-determining protein MreD
VGAIDVSRSLLAITLLGLFLVAVQVNILSGLRVAGVVCMLVWLWPYCLAIVGYGSGAMVSGVGLGLLFDAHSSTPFGLTAVTAGLIGLAASRLAREGIGDLEGAAWWMMPALAAGFGLAAPLLFVLLGIVLLNFSLWHGSLLTAMLVNAVFFALVSRPLARLIERVAGGRRRR